MSATVWVGKPGEAWPLSRWVGKSGAWHPMPVEQLMIARTPGQLWERVCA